MKNKTVVVGMSGGVDSSVAAYLLKEQGYNVIGVTMHVWDDKDCGEDSCCGIAGIEDAKKVAYNLSIPHYVMDFKSEFKRCVMDYFVKEYLSGKTPNPCIACNRYVKWETLLNKSMAIGADYIATGHYAKILHLDNGRYTIANSVTAAKDQSYVLYNLTQNQLAHTLMPVGDYTKDKIRKIASDIGISVANKPDSQEICFIPDHDYASFIKDNTDAELKDGNFVDLEGNIIGRHRGITHYTIGQRKGLNLSLGRPGFVVAIRPSENEVVIGTNDDVFSDRLYADKLNFMAIEDLTGEMNVKAKIRYAHKGAEAVIKLVDKDKVECVFKEQQRAITPGQAVVFYDGEIVLGGGTIC